MPERQLESRPAADWPEANAAYLRGQLRRVRLRLQRRICWLRRQWADDPLQAQRGTVISDARADRLLQETDRAAEARFYREDTRAAELGEAIATLEKELSGQAQQLANAGTPPALEWLAHLFGLDAFESDVLLLCLAPAFDPALGQLCAYAQDDAARPRPTPQLALELFGAPEQDWCEALAYFAPDAPLRRYRLVNFEAAPAQSAAALTIDERLAAYAGGVNRADERVADWLRPLPPALLAPPHHELADRLAHWLRAQPPQAAQPALNLVGAPDTGKRAVARAVCDRLGYGLAQLDLQTISRAGDQAALLRLLDRETILLQTALYLDAAALDAHDQAARTALKRVLEDSGSLLILASQEPWPMERRHLAARVPKPDRSMQRALWRQSLAGSDAQLDGALDALVEQFNFGPAAIAHAAAAAREQARLRHPQGRAEITGEELWQACRAGVAVGLDELAQRLTSAFTWSDLVLPAAVLGELREIAAQVAHRHQVYEGWGFGRKLTRGRGISALFAGPSGTGKTMAAEILANELRLDLYRIDLAGVVSKYIGETEKNLKRVFEAASASGAILFFDEADALFSKRTEVKDSHDRYANIEVNYLLQQMEEYDGLAILATNRKADLDRAFLRRLRFLVEFPFPDATMRRRIWRQVFPAAATLGEVDYDWLSRLELSGGSIRNVALNAAFRAASESAPISMPQLAHAAEREFAKLDRLITETWQPRA